MRRLRLSGPGTRWLGRQSVLGRRCCVAMWAAINVVMTAVLAAWFLLATAADGAESAHLPRTLAANRSWDVLRPSREPSGQRAVLEQAARELGDWQIHLAGVEIDGARLLAICRETRGEPILRAVREALLRPVDLDDFLLFLDDVLLAGRAGRRGELVWITPGRARKAGILLHPDDVFRSDMPRRYGDRPTLAIDQPRPQRDLPQARDGDLLGPNWTTRYRNPAGEQALLAALRMDRSTGDFADRIAELIAQLRAVGAEVYLNSTVRSRERGYLMWGGYVLSRTDTPEGQQEIVGKLERANVGWGLGVPIRWAHPDGWRATRDAARAMSDTYEVVYATEQGARSSNHYDGTAVDLVALGLPRRLALRAPCGETRSFDLSHPEQPRDLSLTPELIDWVERHFGLEKLEADYPHWNDTRAGGGSVEAQ
jgi:hypothetical protein